MVAIFSIQSVSRMREIRTFDERGWETGRRRMAQEL
jgi:hypothetical protein